MIPTSIPSMAARNAAESRCAIIDETEIPRREERYFACAESLSSDVFDREAEKVGRSIFQSLRQYSGNPDLVQRARIRDSEVEARRAKVDLSVEISLMTLAVVGIGVGVWRGGLPGLVLAALLAAGIAYYASRPPTIEAIETFDYR